ncbi:MAG: oligosaccharide flippase family protein [Oscillospiraceae bacterium]|jgi:stage V sporulation protein B|nr:oligosaccharide flippase family protein [Oscillospiraceae bacterium]
MSRSRAMIMNTILLTATSLLMRSVGMVFQVWLSKKIGAAGIGLFQLIMSVSMLAATFAISGIRFAATRLVSMELGLGSGDGVTAAMRRCLVYAACFGVAAGLLLWFGAPVIGGRWIGDERTVLSLHVLSLSLPAYALSAVLAGYFTAVCRVIKSASVAVAEQLIRIGVIFLALGASRGRDIEAACAIVVAGGVAGEMSSFLLLGALYLHDRRGTKSRGGDADGMTRRMFGIAIPLALSAYARTSLSTLQHLLVPRGFRKSGASAERALANYGTVHGMVFPIIMFPSALFYSFAELIVPELTDAQVRGDGEHIRTLATRSLRLCALFSIGLMACMWGFAEELGRAVYSSGDVGRYIKLIAWLVPIMYLDSVADGMLRGLGEQIYCMAVNILDAGASVALVYVLLPRYAMAGYLFMIAFTEIFNFLLSFGRLRRVTALKFPVKSTLAALFAAFGSVNIAVLVTRWLGFSPEPSAVSLTAHIALSLALYLALLLALGCFEAGEIAGAKKFFHRVEMGTKAWYTDKVKTNSLWRYKKCLKSRKIRSSPKS